MTLIFCVNDSVVINHHHHHRPPLLPDEAVRPWRRCSAAARLRVRSGELSGLHEQASALLRMRPWRVLKAEQERMREEKRRRSRSDALACHSPF